MKFEFDEDKERGEVMAIITKSGNLMFPGINGNRITPLQNGGVHCMGSDFGMEPVKKFYRGDKVTITF